jgi:cytochrome c-type biogenesis protein CcmH
LAEDRRSGAGRGELAQKVQASIAEAREHAGGATALAQAKTAPARATAAASSAATAGKVSGTVTLAPALRAQAAPDDTVFVFARPTGGRMPLAVRRAKVADLPLTFTLDDSMAMAPGMTISSVKQLTVSARISKSGNALPQPGDLAGESAAVAPGASGIAVEIGSVLAKP